MAWVFQAALLCPTLADLALGALISLLPYEIQASLATRIFFCLALRTTVFAAIEGAKMQLAHEAVPTMFYSVAHCRQCRNRNNPRVPFGIQTFWVPGLSS